MSTSGTGAGSAVLPKRLSIDELTKRLNEVGNQLIVGRGRGIVCPDARVTLCFAKTVVSGSGVQQIFRMYTSWNRYGHGLRG